MSAVQTRLARMGGAREVESQRGRHFDPVMVDAFLALDHPSAA
jgi:response regulator RpfG family c-di-GMP phosphodiesterase